MPNLKIEICDSPEDAPNYNRDAPDVRSANIAKAVIVLGGMDGGKASVDIQFTDMEGNEFIAMTSGAIITSLADAIRGAEQRGK